MKCFINLAVVTRIYRVKNEEVCRRTGTDESCDGLNKSRERINNTNKGVDADSKFRRLGGIGLIEGVKVAFRSRGKTVGDAVSMRRMGRNREL